MIAVVGEFTRAAAEIISPLAEDGIGVALSMAFGAVVIAAGYAVAVNMGLAKDPYDDVSSSSIAPLNVRELRKRQRVSAPKKLEHQHN